MKMNKVLFVLALAKVIVVTCVAAENGWVSLLNGKNLSGRNDLTIIARGTHVKTVVNGVVCADWDGTGVLDNAAHRERNVGCTGHFALQLHMKDQLRIRFKDIFVRELDHGSASESKPSAPRPNPPSSSVPK